MNATLILFIILNLFFKYNMFITWLICYNYYIKFGWFVKPTLNNLSVAKYGAAMNSGHGKWCKAQAHVA